jgi:hypothetical protein
MISFPVVPLRILEASYVERVVADEPHAHGLTGEHAMLGEGGRFFIRIETVGVLEQVPRPNVVVHAGLVGK